MKHKSVACEHRVANLHLRDFTFGSNSHGAIPYNRKVDRPVSSLTTPSPANRSQSRLPRGQLTARTACITEAHTSKGKRIFAPSAPASIHLQTPSTNAAPTKPCNQACQSRPDSRSRADSCQNARRSASGAPRLPAGVTWKASRISAWRVNRPSSFDAIVAACSASRLTNSFSGTP